MRYILFVLAFSSWMTTYWWTGGTIDSPEFLENLAQATVAGLILVVVWEVNCILFPDERD